MKEVVSSSKKNNLEWNEDVPQEIIKRFSDEIAKNY